MRSERAPLCPSLGWRAPREELGDGERGGVAGRPRVGEVGAGQRDDGVDQRGGPARVGRQQRRVRRLQVKGHDGEHGDPEQQRIPHFPRPGGSEEGQTSAVLDAAGRRPAHLWSAASWLESSRMAGSTSATSWGKRRTTALAPRTLHKVYTTWRPPAGPGQRPGANAAQRWVTNPARGREARRHDAAARKRAQLDGLALDRGRDFADRPEQELHQALDRGVQQRALLLVFVQLQRGDGARDGVRKGQVGTARPGLLTISQTRFTSPSSGASEPQTRSTREKHSARSANRSPDWRSMEARSGHQTCSPASLLGP